MKYLPQGKYVWADWKRLHEQGKVVRNIFPVITETYQGMMKIKPLPETDFDRKFQEGYDEFWINPADLVDDAIQQSTITDAMAGVYFVAIMKWIASLFK